MSINHNFATSSCTVTSSTGYAVIGKYFAKGEDLSFQYQHPSQYIETKP